MEHTPRIETFTSGIHTPSRHTVRCSCGWQSATTESPSYVLGRRAAANEFISHFLAVVPDAKIRTVSGTQTIRDGYPVLD